MLHLNGWRRRINIRKLLRWGKEDVPILLAALAAILSFVSTPRLPPSPPGPNSFIDSLLRQASDDECRARIRDLWQEQMQPSSYSPELSISEHVTALCHRPIDKAETAMELQKGLWDGIEGEGERVTMQRHWRRYSETDSTARLPTVAMFLMVGPRDTPEGISVLIELIHQPHHVYLINVDSKSPAALHDVARKICQQYPDNVYVLDPPGEATWGAFSMVLLELRGMAALLAVDHWWDFWINLSGQDVPLLSDHALRTRLAGQGAANWMQAWPSNTTFDSGAVECQGRLFKVVSRRVPPRGIRRFQGSQWVILSREFTSFVIQCMAGDLVWGSRRDCEAVREYARYSSVGFIPDEGFFQTILLNSPFCHTWHPDNSRYINWGSGKHERECATTSVVGACGNSPDHLTLPVLLRVWGDRKWLFARKADPRHDSRVYPMLTCLLEKQSLSSCARLMDADWPLTSHGDGSALNLTVSSSDGVSHARAIFDGDLRTKGSFARYPTSLILDTASILDDWLQSARRTMLQGYALVGGWQWPWVLVSFGSEVQATEIRLYWEGEEGAWGYEVEVCGEDGDWESIATSESRASVSWTYPNLPFETVPIGRSAHSLRIKLRGIGVDAAALLEAQVWGTALPALLEPDL